MAVSTVVRYVKGFHPSVANEVINLSADPSFGGEGETKQEEYNWWIKRFEHPSKIKKWVKNYRNINFLRRRLGPVGLIGRGGWIIRPEESFLLL